MTTITVWSECGGVGKTTTSLNLAAGLGRLGQNVLLVDLDPQPGSLTDYAGSPEAKTADTDETLTNALLDESEVTIADLVIEDDFFDLIPAHESLASLEGTVHREGVSMGEFLLQSALDDVESEYDYVIIDPPATLSLLVDNALIASEHVLIPMEMTRKGERSISGVLETVSSLETQLQRAQPNFSLDVLGILPNKVSDSTLNQDVQSSLEESGMDILPMTVPDYNVMEEAWEQQMDIFRYADSPDHGLRAYQESLLESYEELTQYILNETAPQTEVVA